MDLLIYCIIITSVGFYRIHKTKDVSDDVGIIQVGTQGSSAEIPVGSNLALKREYGAYTLILEELGLK